MQKVFGKFTVPLIGTLFFLVIAVYAHMNVDKLPSIKEYAQKVNVASMAAPFSDLGKNMLHK